VGWRRGVGPGRGRGGKEEWAAPAGQKERVREIEPEVTFLFMHCIFFSKAFECFFKFRNSKGFLRKSATISSTSKTQHITCTTS